MKTMLSSRSNYYLARVSIFLTMIALIAGMVGCGAPAKYDLTIAADPAVGGTAADETNGSPYAEGTVVSIKAEANSCYEFAGWTVQVGTFADANAEETTFTIPAQDVAITANFVAVTKVEIWDWYDLDAIRENLSGCYVLMNDLDAATAGYEELAGPIANEGRGWQPIGTEDIYDLLAEKAFTGAFDGQGYEMGDLFISRPDERNVGLFGCIRSPGVIDNIAVVNADVTGDYGVGELAGGNGGTVVNSYSTGSVTGTWDVGGLVGVNAARVGGGHIAGTVDDCYATTIVTGDFGVGGLVGANPGTVSDSYFTGSVVGNYSIGGLVGVSGGTVTNSYYNYDEVLMNGGSAITTGALFVEDFEEWLAAGKSLDVNQRLSQEDGYYLIDDVGDFKELLVFGQDGSLKFKLTNDLDLVSEPNFYVPYLAGEFDGDGHRIMNMSLDFDLAFWNVGLFAYVASGGEVRNVGVENVNIAGALNIGGVAGQNMGTVSNSYSTGSVGGIRRVGGLVGFNGNWVYWNPEGTVTNSYSTCDVTGNYSSIGGLVGQNVGTVSNSYSAGRVTGGEFVGGLVGLEGDTVMPSRFVATVTNSYATGNVTGDSSVGGLIGRNEGGFVRHAFSTGSVTGESEVGGLVGDNRGHVSNCYATASVDGYVRVGGLMGQNRAPVNNCYFTGSVTGEREVGGVVGYNIGSTGVLSNCYSTGSVSGGERVGGLVGRNEGSLSSSYSTGSVSGDQDAGGLVGTKGGTVSNSFWDLLTSGMEDSGAGAGKTTAEMMAVATFADTATQGLNEPWDITAVASGMTDQTSTWNIVDGQTYPFLSTEQEIEDAQTIPADLVRVKAGDWIKVEYEISGWPAGEPRPEWLKLEFLGVEGTSATVQVTMRISDGTEQSDTVPADLDGGGGEALGLAGFVIPPNLTTGDFIVVYDDVMTIAGKTTKAYAGAERTVVYASFSQYGVQLTHYWDQETGVMVEASSTQDGVTVTARATETNMW